MKNAPIAAYLADKYCFLKVVGALVLLIASYILSFLGMIFFFFERFLITQKCAWRGVRVILSALLTLTGVLSLLPGWRSKSTITSGRMP